MKKTPVKLEIILSYADWCTHCHTFMPTWDKLVDEIKSSKYVSTHAYESQDNMPEKYKKFRENGYPSIILNIGDTTTYYSGHRTPDKIYEAALAELLNVLKIR
jgi:thiol-disulfide isomerase/thioredoxin